MNQTVKMIGAFAVGAACGAYGMYRYVRNYFEQKTEEEVKKAHDYYRKKYSEEEDDEIPTSDESIDVAEYQDKLQELGYLKEKTDYAGVRTADLPAEPDIGPKPYIISPEEFGELDGYAMITLTYFADGILTDENDEIIDDVEATVGDGLSHFGEYEADSVWVRNDRRRCDFEILKSNGRFEDFADRVAIPVEV